MGVRSVGSGKLLRTTRLRTHWPDTHILLHIHDNNVRADLFDIFVTDVAVIVTT